MNITTRNTATRAIRTKYYGPTSTKPARIIASAGAGTKATATASMTVMDINQAHEHAALCLAEHLKWKGRWIGAWFDGACYWTNAATDYQAGYADRRLETIERVLP